MCSTLAIAPQLLSPYSILFSFGPVLSTTPPSLLYFCACRFRHEHDEKERRLRLGEATTVLESSTAGRGDDGARTVGELQTGRCCGRGDICLSAGELEIRPGHDVKELEL